MADLHIDAAIKYVEGSDGMCEDCRDEIVNILTILKGGKVAKKKTCKHGDEAEVSGERDTPNWYNDPVYLDGAE